MNKIILMGVAVGIVIGFLGVGILLAPFIIQIYVGTKQSNKFWEPPLNYENGIA